MFSRLSRRVPSSAPAAPPDEAALPELNAALAALAAVFPAHDAALLRTLLLAAAPESRLPAAAHALAQHPQRDATRRPQLLAPWEQFRAPAYTTAVQKLLTAEYTGLTAATVRSVLAAHNYDYARSRAALADTAAASWRARLVAWLAPRNAPSGPPAPTGCAPLDAELHALDAPARAAQSAHDAQLARALNAAEHAAAHALLECECCFDGVPPEDAAACTQGHVFCAACLARSVREALFGQGAGLHPGAASARCIAAAAGAPCVGFVPPALLAQVLPAELLVRLEERFARDAVRDAGLPLRRCPACPYAAEAHPSAARLRAPAALVLLAILLSFCRSPRGALAALSACCVLAGVLAQAHSAFARVRRRHTGAQQCFRCASPRCGMESCVDCGRAWAPFHDCDREDSERLHVERAMSEAVKRTCPQCHTSFVKIYGCNKLTCPCGYAMCYVCRADVRAARYSHFCPHFRVIPGTPCHECARCSLYAGEDEQAVAAAAGRRAAEDWARGGEGTGGGDTRLVLGQVDKAMEYLIELLFEW